MTLCQRISQTLMRTNGAVEGFKLPEQVLHVSLAENGEMAQAFVLGCPNEVEPPGMWSREYWT